MVYRGYILGDSVNIGRYVHKIIYPLFNVSSRLIPKNYISGDILAISVILKTMVCTL